MSLILVFNMRDEIMASGNIDKSELISRLEILKLKNKSSLTILLIILKRNNTKCTKHNKCRRFKRFQYIMSTFCC